MSKTASIHVRVEPDLKDKVEKIFHEIGLSSSDAITIFYKQVLLNHGIPFEVKIPNDETMKVFNNTDKHKNLITPNSEEELFRVLDE